MVPSRSWVPDAEECSNIALQRGGVDLLLTAQFKIQVKCDWIAGPKELGGKGNLFIQDAELNPKKRY